MSKIESFHASQVVMGGIWHIMALDRRFRNDLECSMENRPASGTQT